MRWELTAIISLSLASFRPIRNLAYEVFLMSHVVFVKQGFTVVAQLDWRPSCARNDTLSAIL